MTKQTIKNALEKIGVTDEQKQAEFFAAFAEKELGKIGESDAVAALNKIGVTDKKALGDFFAAVKEPEIMDQELDIDELDAVAGGNKCHDDDEDTYNCVQQTYRPLYVNGVKNCAATVELDRMGVVDSSCRLNDGCQYNAVIYDV